MSARLQRRKEGGLTAWSQACVADVQASEGGKEGWGVIVVDKSAIPQLQNLQQRSLSPKEAIPRFSVGLAVAFSVHRLDAL